MLRGVLFAEKCRNSSFQSLWAHTGLMGVCDTCLCVLCIGDIALLVDTSHPLIRPGLEKGLDTARKIIQTGQGFCLQVLPAKL